MLSLERQPDCGELDEIAWVDMDEARALDLPAVTRFVLGELVHRLNAEEAVPERRIKLANLEVELKRIRQQGYAAEYGEFRVYVVEVCQSCSWHHLATSYVLGTGEQPVGRRRRARPS